MEDLMSLRVYDYNFNLTGYSFAVRYQKQGEMAMIFWSAEEVAATANVIKCPV